MSTGNFEPDVPGQPMPGYGPGHGQPAPGYGPGHGQPAPGYGPGYGRPMPGYGPGYGQMPGYGQPGGHPPPTAWGGRPGGLGARFAARLIDGILVNLVAFVLSLVMLGNGYFFLVNGLFSGVLTFGYFVLFEVTQGATPGKRLLGLRVRGPGGSPRPDASQSAIRNAFTLLAVVPYVGTLLAFVTYIVIAVTINSSVTKQGKHDEFAGGTQVVKD